MNAADLIRALRDLAHQVEELQADLTDMQRELDEHNDRTKRLEDRRMPATYGTENPNYVNAAGETV